MIFDFSPYKQVGRIEFGMSRKTARELLGNMFESFLRTSDDIIPCDYYNWLGLIVYYSSSLTVEAIEFGNLDNRLSQVLYDKHELLSFTPFQLIEFLQSKDESIEIESDSATSYLLGIAVHFELDFDDEYQKIESILLFKDGYYS